jgi:hypothetical protein
MGIQTCAQTWVLMNLTNQSFLSFSPKFQKHLEDLGLISASTQVAYTMKQQQSLHPELGSYKYYYLCNDTGLPVLFNVYFFQRWISTMIPCYQEDGLERPLLLECLAQ